MNSVETMSRRELLKRTATAGKVVVASALLSSTESCNRPFDDAAFFKEIQNIPIDEQLRRTEITYSQHLLSVKVAKQDAIPLWVDGYLSHSGFFSTRAKILSEAIIYSSSAESGDTGDITFNPADRSSQIQFNVTSYPNNKILRIGADSVFGITYLRSRFVEQVSNFDSPFRDNTVIGPMIVANIPLTPPLKHPESLVVKGFTFSDVNVDKTYTNYFYNLDRTASDVIQSYISEEEGLTAVLTGHFSPITRDFLDWIQLRPEQFREFHQTSNIEGLAIYLAQISHLQTRTLTVSQAQLLTDGLKIMKIFDSEDATQLENFFPGITQAVVNQPSRHVRLPSSASLKQGL